MCVCVCARGHRSQLFTSLVPAPSNQKLPQAVFRTIRAVVLNLWVATIGHRVFSMVLGTETQLSS